MTATALIVDDEVDLCRLMQMTLSKMRIKSDVAYDLSSARHYLSESNYDFCLTDMRLPDGSGLDLVKYITQQHCDMPVAVITAHGNMDIAIEALKLGAFDFVNKPLELSRLRQLIEHALRVTQESQDSISSNEENTNRPSESQLPKKSQSNLLLDKYLIGNSPVIVKLKSTIIKLARSQAPVFLWGESGTGKEVVAKLIHQLSPRREGEFIAVNCGAIPTELMESEFFGHKKGSFTGATTDKKGLFQQADGGTLFLDEVADLPLSMQVKLLRAIQEKSVRAIGDTKEVPVDIRILSATHKDLNQLVQQGQFRQDLFYRINVIELKLPRLSERGDDIALLATHFLQQIADEWHLDSIPTLSDEANKALQNHDFEGNVRELRNVLERAITLSDSETLTAEHLGLSQNTTKKESMLQNGTTTLPTHDSTNNAIVDTKAYADTETYKTNTATLKIEDRPYRQMSEDNLENSNGEIDNGNVNTHCTTKIDASFSSNLDINANSLDVNTNKTDIEHTNQSLPEKGLESYLQEQERQLIILALSKTNGNKTQAAKLLGTSFRSLRYRMKKLEIDTNDDND